MKSFNSRLNLSDLAARQTGSLIDCGLSEDVLVVDQLNAGLFSEQTLQLGFIVYVFCSKGSANFTINAKACELRPGDLLISFGNQRFKDCRASEDFEGKMMLISQQFSKDSIVGLKHLWPYLLFLMEHPVLHLDEAEQKWLFDCYGILIKRLTNSRGHRFLRDFILSLNKAFYFDICNLLGSRLPDVSKEGKNRSYILFDHFMHLLSDNFRRERNVAWYSEQLGITPKHLSEVVKNVSGRTASYWITSFVLMEIKSLLRNTSYSVKEIADKMNFSSQSFLGKYFKNATGISPSEFRQSNE